MPQSLLLLYEIADIFLCGKNDQSDVEVLVRSTRRLVKRIWGEARKSVRVSVVHKVRAMWYVVEL